MRLDVLIFTNEQAWLREDGGAGGAGGAEGAGEDGEAEEAGEAEGAFFVGAGFTTNVSFSP
ncbi:MAG: hypothetical protein RH949_20945 [Coleofasciculus sp. A1-SPW-01]|uniref:hypothetical protein n=1 Tax=Coleofasciculus sp. A1-SPW-01 TaxID=3070819 RepID=UPI0032F78AD7